MERPKILIAEITATPGRIAEVADLLTGYGKVVRQEPGNRAFTVHHVDGAPERFVIHEIYADETAFRAHLAAPENAVLNARLGPLVEGGGSVLTFLLPLDTP